MTWMRYKLWGIQESISWVEQGPHTNGGIQEVCHVVPGSRLEASALIVLDLETQWSYAREGGAIL